MNANTRKWVYDVLTALGLVVAFYGLMTGEEVALWLGVGSQLLQSGGTLLARKNVTPDTAEPKHIKLVELDTEGLESLANTLSRRTDLSGRRTT